MLRLLAVAQCLNNLLGDERSEDRSDGLGGVANGLDVADDPDGDGFTNEEEFLANTDPTNSLSALRITDISVSETNVVLSWWSSQDGFRNEREYDVFWSQDLMASSEEWTCIASNVPPDSLETTITNDIAGLNTTNSFFRVSIAGSVARVHSDNAMAPAME